MTGKESNEMKGVKEAQTAEFELELNGLNQSYGISHGAMPALRATIPRPFPLWFMVNSNSSFCVLETYSNCLKCGSTHSTPTKPIQNIQHA